MLEPTMPRTGEFLGHSSTEAVNGRTYFRPLGSSSTLLPCIKPIRDSSESSSQAEAFITNRPCSPSTPNVHCHRMHSISYLRQQMQRCISFPIPGNRCRTSGLYNCAVSPALDRTSVSQIRPCLILAPKRAKPDLE